MRKLAVFNNVSLDGYFTDKNNDMSWAHKRDEEWNAYSSSNARGEAELLFGRVTYEMMASFWPTAEAVRMLPDVAAGMNRMKKHVVSRTLKRVGWQNSELLDGDLVAAAARLKQQPGPDVLILGSGNIVHNLRLWGTSDPRVFAAWKQFNDAVKQRIAAGDHEAVANYETLAPHAALSVPTPEHYLPLLYVLGVKRPEDKVTFFNDEDPSAIFMTSLLLT